MQKKSRRVRDIVILTAVSFGFSLVLLLLDALAPFENRSFDLFSRYMNPESSSGRVVIIEIDQQSVDALSAEGINWPWPRQVYAPIVEFTSLADALFIDILYTEPSSYGQEDDTIFGEAVEDASNVYLPFFLSRNEKALSTEDESFLRRFVIPGDSLPVPAYLSVTAPIDVIRHGVKGSGNVAIGPDSDGVYRKIPLVFGLGDMALPNLVFSYFTARGAAKTKGGELTFNDRFLPLIDGKLLLRYARGNAPFTVISAVDILSAYRGVIPPGEKGMPTKDFFKGKVVFLGMTAAGLFDLKPTPISALSTGVHINATLFENLERGDFMRPVGVVFVVLSILVLSASIIIFVLTFHTILQNLSALLIGSLFIVAATALLFSHTFYLPATYLVVSLLASFILSAAFSYASEGRERQFIKRTFSQYMDKTIVDYVLQDPDLIKPGGKKARVTILFADIAGFTTISEENTPEDTALMLHRILNELTEVVIEEKGVVDKYIGDCIMAFWGTPLKTTEDPVNACRSALRFIDSVKKINVQFQKEGVGPIHIRVGLHTGDVIAGNMGSVRLFDFTVIGDAVNVASRLESVNKVFGTEVMVSGQTLDDTYGLFLAREIGPIEVKGRSEPVTVHELLCEADAADPSLKRRVGLYGEALSHYRRQRFHDAMRLFDELLAEFPGDGPSIFYKKRCQSLKENYSLTKNWDIIKMTEK